MSDFIIRRAVSEDAPALTRVIAAAYDVYADRGLDLPPVADGVADDIAVHKVWVAEIGSAIIGGLILVLHDDHAHLANVAVDPARSGKGVGRALIEQAAEACGASGLPEMRLATHVGLPENVAMYEHLGWRQTGRAGNKVFMARSVLLQKLV